MTGIEKEENKSNDNLETEVPASALEESAETIKENAEETKEEATPVQSIDIPAPEQEASEQEAQEEEKKETEISEPKSIESEVVSKEEPAEEKLPQLSEEQTEEISAEEAAPESNTKQAEAAPAEEIAPKSEEAVQPPEEKKAEIKTEPHKNWYVIHTYSGYENKVRDNLIKRIESMRMHDKIFQVLVPTEEEIEFREGKKRTVQKKIYPGYVLVQMIMNDDSWYVVRNTPGVTGFVGSGIKPLPLQEEEIKQILRIMGIEAPLKVKIALDQGQGVRVKSGPFKDFTGIVDEIYPEKEKIRVLIHIFGRETPVEIDFGQIEKL